MPTTPYLGIEQLTPNQSQKELTINDAILALEQAITGTLVVDFGAEVTINLSAEQFTRYFVFKVPTTTAEGNLRIPTLINGQPSSRVFVVNNQSGHQLHVKTQSGAGAEVAIPNGECRFLAVADDDVFIAAEQGTLVNFTDLSDSPGTFAGAAGKVIVVNDTENSLEYAVLAKNLDDLADVDTSTAGNGQVLVRDGPGNKWVPATLALGSTTFTGLTDTPSTYAAQAGRFIRVNAGANALEFADVRSVPTGGDTGQVLTKTDIGYDWIDNADSSATYPDFGGNAGKQLTVNETETGVFWSGEDAGVIGSTGIATSRVGAHRYWMIDQIFNGADAASISELVFRTSVGGENLAPPVTTTNITGSYNDTSKLYDNDPSTFFSDYGNTPGHGWLKFDFTTPVRLAELGLSDRNDGHALQTPQQFRVSYSDDGEAWYALATVDGPTFSGDGTMKYMPLPITFPGGAFSLNTGASGGQRADVPQVIQWGHGRGSGSATVNIGQPEVGNWLIFICSGYWSGKSFPAGFTVLFQYNTTNNQTVAVAVKKVDGTDGTSYTVNGSDVNNAMVIEVDRIDYIDSTASGLTTYNSNHQFRSVVPAANFGASLMFYIMEHDNSDTADVVGDPTPQFKWAYGATEGGNHRGVTAAYVQRGEAIPIDGAFNGGTGNGSNPMYAVLWIGKSGGSIFPTFEDNAGKYLAVLPDETGAEWVSPQEAESGLKTALARLTADHTINAGWAPVAWDIDASADATGAWDIANPARITVPDGVTKVRLTGYAAFNNGSGDFRGVAFTKNGTNVDSNCVQVIPDNRTYEGNKTLISAWLDVEPGDFFIMQVDPGAAAQTLYSDANTGFGAGSFFQMEWVASVNLPAVRIMPIYRLNTYWTLPLGIDETLLIHPVVNAFTFPGNLTGSYAYVGTAPSDGDVVLTMKKIHGVTTSTVGTITITNATGAVTFATPAGAPVDFDVGDIFLLVGPTVPDSTFANFGITFKGSSE